MFQQKKKKEKKKKRGKEKRLLVRFGVRGWWIAYPIAVNGTSILMVTRYSFVRSTSGDTMAEATKPTTMRMAPAMPASVSLKP